MSERFIDRARKVIQNGVFAGALAVIPVSLGCDLATNSNSVPQVSTSSDSELVPDPDPEREYAKLWRAEWNQASPEKFRVKKEDLSLLTRLITQNMPRNIDPEDLRYLTEEIPNMSGSQLEAQVQKTPWCGVGSLPSDECYEFLVSPKGELSDYSSAILMVWVYPEGGIERFEIMGGDNRQADIFYAVTVDKKLGRVNDWNANKSGVLTPAHVIVNPQA